MTATYTAYVERLFTINRGLGMKLGLDNMLALDEALGHPSRACTYIHVGGTNGKGTVCTKIAANLPGTVGLFTSPHISSFRERIRVNGTMITEQEVCDGLDRIWSTELPATFFEIVAILALTHCADRCDYAVIEVGLGGTLDATNIIDSAVQAIVSIGMDHMEILGDTPEKIAADKAGIMRSGKPVIIGPTVPRAVIDKRADEIGATVIAVDGNDINETNTAIAVEALRVLGVTPTDLDVMPSCRCEEVRPGVILDIAHNPAAFAGLRQQIEKRYPGKTCEYLIGFTQGKEWKDCVAEIPDDAAITVVSTGDRTIPADVIAQGLTGREHYIPSSIEEGIAQSLTRCADTGRILVVTGSFAVMSRARQALGVVEPTDPWELNEYASTAWRP